MEESVSLKDFLNFFDFDYKRKENSFSLIDLQGTNINNICDEKFDFSHNGISLCIDYLDSYINDYIFKCLRNNMGIAFNTIDEIIIYSNYSADNYRKLDYLVDMKIVYAIANPKNIIVE